MQCSSNKQIFIFLWYLIGGLYWLLMPFKASFPFCVSGVFCRQRSTVGLSEHVSVFLILQMTGYGNRFTLVCACCVSLCFSCIYSAVTSEEFRPSREADLVLKVVLRLCPRVAPLTRLRLVYRGSKIKQPLTSLRKCTREYTLTNIRPPRLPQMHTHVLPP